MSDEPSEHPLSHIDRDKCYDWLRADCAALNLARQSREDALITTVTQISSAALLAIPGFLLGSDHAFPSWQKSPLLFIGIGLFVLALALAMLEQYLSATSYRRQTDIARDFYLQVSNETEDKQFVHWLDWTRNAAYLAFAGAVLVSATALMRVERASDAKSASSPAAPSSASAATATAASSAASSAAAPAGAPSATRITPPELRGRTGPEIESRTDHSTTKAR